VGEGSPRLTADGPSRELTTSERVGNLEKQIVALQRAFKRLPEVVEQELQAKFDLTLHAMSGELRGLRRAVWKYASETKAPGLLWWFSVVLAVSGTVLEMAAAFLTWPP